MAASTVKAGKLADPPEWIFPWRDAGSPIFPKLFALAVCGAGFTLLVTAVRIQVDAPEKSSPRKAAVIYLRDDAQGRALMLKAREGGPFPSRFELERWPGMAALEGVAMDALAFEPPAYTPELQELPSEVSGQPLELAAKGELFFPERLAPLTPRPEPTALEPAPVLYPLAGISAGDLPRELPPFAGPVDGAMRSASWRFLVRLNPHGGVAESISLESGGEAGARALENWLRGIRFAPSPEKQTRWITLGLGFTNQPADGPDAR